MGGSNNNIPSSISSLDPITLSKYDDLLSDVLLDQVGLWFATRKMLPKYRKARIPENQGVDIVKRVARGEANLPEAVEELTRIEYITAFLRHKSQIRYQDFCLHAARYFSMYLPEAGYEVSLTSRYKVVSGHAEACVIATRKFEAGEVISLCSGSIACLDDANLKRMESEKADFSVIWWSKKRHMCLFLGPARFVNHDCNSNCRFTALGSDAVCFQALRTIKPGEEITTHYGQNYFGNNNCECLCASCEKYGRGWYTKTVTSPTKETKVINGQEVSVPRRMRTRNSGRVSTPLSQNDLGDDAPVCSVCRESMFIINSPKAINSGANGAQPLPICLRCERHKLVYGLPWPKRPKVDACKYKRNGKVDGNHISLTPGLSLTRQKRKSQGPPMGTLNELVDKYSTSIYADGNGTIADINDMFNKKLPGTPVFIDPLESGTEVWWPAIIVSNGSEEEELEVCFLEDGSYSECNPDEIKPFSPFSEPFTSWFNKFPNIINDPAFRRAICYYEWRFLAPLDRQPLHSIPKSTSLVNGTKRRRGPGFKKTKKLRTPLIKPTDGDKNETRSSCGESVATTDDNATTIVDIETESNPPTTTVTPSPASTLTLVPTVAGTPKTNSIVPKSLNLKTHESSQLGVNEILTLAKTFPEAVDKSWMLTLPPLQPQEFYIDESLKTTQQPTAANLEADSTVQDSTAVSNPEKLHHCILSYTLQVGDKAIILDNRNAKPYEGRIEDVDIVNNEKRQGFYYYVHFKGWNRRYDEWVSPCRILSIIQN